MQAKRALNWFEEVWHKRNETAIDDLLHPDAVIHGLNTEPGKTGPEAFKPFFRDFCNSFPEINVAVTPIFVDGDFEAFYCDVTGRDASGKNVHFDGISICKFQDGQIIEGWNGFDFVKMYDQMGFKLVKQESEAALA